MARGSPSSSGKKTRGRRRIEIKKIEKEMDKLVTFSKRRSGLFKKASELSTLCGAEVAILAFSPGGKAFTYGNPSFESVMNEYMNENLPTNDYTDLVAEAQRMVRINMMAQQLNEVEAKIQVEQERGKKLAQFIAEAKSKRWWEVPIEEMNHEQLQHRKKTLEDLRKRVVDAMMARNAMYNPCGAYLGNINYVPMPNNGHGHGYGFPPQGPF